MIKKIGTSIHSIKILKNEDLDKIRKVIAEENTLIRCPKCNHLLAKEFQNTIDIQHKKQIVTINEFKKITIRCPICKTNVEIF